MEPFLIYGVTGYTGGLIAEEAVRRGWRPIVAGRDETRVAALAERLGLERRTFALDDAAAVRDGLQDVAAVLHCAGPFRDTAEPVIAACIDTGVHYLDITGEIDVFALAIARSHEAERRGVMLMPGVGFDVVPSDCLALHLKETLPSASRLTLLIDTPGNISRGTALTGLPRLGQPPRVQRAGQIVPAVGLPRSLRRDAGRGRRLFSLVTLGDTLTAYHSTGIGDIAAYHRLPAVATIALRMGWLLRSQALQKRLRARFLSGPSGPDLAALGNDRCYLLARAEDDEGWSVERRLETPEAYALTVQTALHMMDKTLAGGALPGFVTPATAFGSNAVLEIEGVEGFLAPVAGSG